MSEVQPAAVLPKWPFYLADVVLSTIIVVVLWQLSPLEGTTDVVITLACLAGAAWAAWISITPWLTEHRASVHLTESSNLRSTLEQIQSLESVADLIKQSNLQWQGVQDAAGRTVGAAREISDKMKLESEEFMRFLDNAHNSERSGLKLEVEKLRRMEGEWIKVVVQILDHIYAITRAAERSGQAQLIAQMQQFQNACRDIGRRIGLSTFIPAISETFDGRAHQLPDPEFKAPADAKVGEVLATGFTYQGQLLRRSLVMLEGNPPEAVKSDGLAEGIETPGNQNELPLS